VGGEATKQATVPGIHRRLASMLYESLLLTGILALLFLVPNMLVGMFWQLSLPGWAQWLNIVVVLGVYFVWLWHRTGQTLAMQTWRIRIVAGNDVPPSVQQALIRYLLAWPSVLSVVGLLWALFDRDGQFLHDRLAGTRIVFRR
jgi:uncharacterized RDD family membrane protein YckC